MDKNQPNRHQSIQRTVSAEEEKQNSPAVRDQSEFILDLTRQQTSQMVLLDDIDGDAACAGDDDDDDDNNDIKEHYKDDDDDAEMELDDDDDKQETDIAEFILNLTSRHTTSDFSDSTTTNEGEEDDDNDKMATARKVENDNDDFIKKKKKEDLCASPGGSKSTITRTITTTNSSNSIAGTNKDKNKETAELTKRQRKGDERTTEQEQPECTGNTKASGNDNGDNDNNNEAMIGIPNTPDLTRDQHFTPPGAVRVNGVDYHGQEDDHDDDDDDSITRSAQDAPNQMCFGGQQQHQDKDGTTIVNNNNAEETIGSSRDTGFFVEEESGEQIIAEPIQQADLVIKKGDEDDNDLVKSGRSASGGQDTMRKMMTMLLCVGTTLLIMAVIVVVVLASGKTNDSSSAATTTTKDGTTVFGGNDEGDDDGMAVLPTDNNTSSSLADVIDSTISNSTAATEAPIFSITANSTQINTLSQMLFPILLDYPLGGSTINNILDTNLTENGQPTMQRRAFLSLATDPNLESYPTKRVLRRFAMGTFYFATRGHSWTINTGWLDHALHECDWYGIVSPEACKRAGDSSAEILLHLPSNNLYGRIPHELTYLVDLVSLNLNYNRLQSMSSRAVFTLEKLQQLSLHDNEIISNFGGMIDGRCAERNRCHYLFERSVLREIDLSSNRLHGKLPVSFMSLNELTVLIVDDNPELSGTIPEEYCQHGNFVENLLEISIEGTGITTIENDREMMCSNIVEQP